MSGFEIWKNQIVLRLDPAPVDPATGNYQPHDPAKWIHLGDRVKWSERMGAFFLALSKQNLQRIYKQFGPLRVIEGQGRIESLKHELRRFNKMLDTAELAKTSPVLPVYPYKVKPLGPYQDRGVVYLVNVERSALFADCGTGKTYMVACAVEQLKRHGIIRTGQTLVCVKLATIYNGWLDDIAQFTNLTASVLWTSSQYKRREKILKALDLPADIYLINHEGLRIYQNELAAKGFRYVVVDESTVMKSFHSNHAKAKGGAFAKALLHVAGSAPRRTIMTGTPASNGGQDLWGQTHFLDPNGFMLEASWRDFKSEYMDPVYFGDPSDPNTIKSFALKPDSNERIGAIVNRLAYRVRIRDVLPDLPERTIMKRMVDMSRDQAKHYAEMERTLHTEIDEAHISVSIKLAQIQKLSQITAGFIIDAEQQAHGIDEVGPKLEMLDQLLREEIGPDKKVVIFAQYQWEFELLAERYKDLGILTYYGGNTAKQKMDALDMFIKDPTPRPIALHPKSCAHGVTFTCAHYMIFLTISHSSEEDYQCIKRIERNSQKHAMFIYYILCRDTVDEAKFDNVQLKHHNQATLIDPDLQGDDTATIWAKLKEQVARHKRKRKKQ